MLDACVADVYKLVIDVYVHSELWVHLCGIIYMNRGVVSLITG